MSIDAKRKFLRAAAICAILTSLTTTVVHIVPTLWADVDTFDERLNLSTNPLYMGRLWVVLLHCALVVISMYGAGLVAFRHAPILVSFGFLCFVVFALIEWVRTSLGIFALNRSWRSGFLSAESEAVKESMRTLITSFGGFNDALFFVFSTFFIVGTICYGIALATGEHRDKRIGFLLLFWALVSIPGWISTVTGFVQFASYFEWVGPYFQPPARLLIGIWLWLSAAAESINEPLDA